MRIPPSSFLLCRLLFALGLGVVSACSTVPDRVVRKVGIGDVSLITDQENPLRNLTADRADKLSIAIGRRQDVAHRLKAGSAWLCGARVTYEAGLSYLSAGMLGRIGAQSSATRLGVSDRLTVFHVVPGSAADRAGVKAGDEIEQISGPTVPEGPPEAATSDQNLERALKSGKQFMLHLRRGSTSMPILIEPEKVCDLEVTQLICDICTSDLEVDESTLALYISHNMAHELLGHYDRLQNVSRNVLIPDIPFYAASVALLFVGWAKPIAPFEQAKVNRMREEFEPKADLLSLYMVAAARYDPQVAVVALRNLVEQKKYSYALHAVTAPALDVRTDFWGNVIELTRKRHSLLETEATKIADRQKSAMPLFTGEPALEALIREIADVNSQRAKTTPQ